MAAKPTLRVVTTAAELGAGNRYCSCCERPLTGKVAMLELDRRIDEYHDCGGVPEDKSQGWFPFGMTCAAKAKAAALKKLPTA